MRYETMGHEIPNIEDYLGTLENLAYNTHYDLDLSNAPHLVLRPNSSCVYPEYEMPTIYGDYKTDGERFWFEPRMEFPKILKDNMFEDGYCSIIASTLDGYNISLSLLKSSTLKLISIL